MELPQGDTKWLGATIDKEKGGTNFAFYTGAAASGAELCLFDKAQGPCNETRYSLTSKEEVRNDEGKLLGYIWNGFAQGVGEGALYGLRVHGLYEPEHGNFHNPQKLLVDPCAKAVTAEIHSWHPSQYPDNEDDNYTIMPKARVVDWQKLQEHAAASSGALYSHADTNILEVHVKGATILHPDLPEGERGTYKGLSNPAFIHWVKDMGFTSIELMPVESFGTDAPLADRGKKNYWGYMTMAATAPHTGYAATDKPEEELAQAISAMKKEGIEVIMDVVPNHTLESGKDGPVVNLRGMDSYLYLQKRDYTGTGNTRDFGHPINRRMFLEELKYWKGLGVSGFRIDLATVIGREGGKDFNPDSHMMADIRNDPELKDVKLYGEPWDLGPAACFGEQIGHLAHDPAPPAGKESNPIAEWDGKARDLLEKAALDHDVAIDRGKLINVLAGNSEVYPNPQHHVVKFGSHDGATPADRVSYDHKHNEANGEENRDGNDMSPSCYWGNDADRQRVQQFAIAMLALAQGPHMMTLGHERGKSQGGNTNPYCQDNDITHIPWGERVSPAGRQLMEFTRSANHLRLAHPSLRRGRSFTGTADGNSDLQFGGGAMKDVTWLDTNASEMHGSDFNRPGAFGMLLSGDPGDNTAEPLGTTRRVHRPAHDTPLLVLVNPTMRDEQFTLPDVPGITWKPRLNSLPSQANGHDGNTTTIGWRSLTVYEGHRTRQQGADGEHVRLAGKSLSTTAATAAL